MKIAVFGAAICIAISPAVFAQGGGYPASPSHAVTGTNPDGTPRYGSEPGKDANPSPNTVGRSGPDDHSSARPADDPVKDGSGTSERSGHAAPR
jgi:hypothetical protein